MLHRPRPQAFGIGAVREDANREIYPADPAG